MNDVKLLGRIAWKKFTSQNGSSVYNFILAVESRWKKVGAEPNWIPCVAFGKTAEILNEHYKVGQQVCISDSELQTRKWIQDGTEREKMEVLVHRISQIYTSNKENRDVDVLHPEEKGFIEDESDKSPI